MAGAGRMRPTGDNIGPSKNARANLLAPNQLFDSFRGAKGRTVDERAVSLASDRPGPTRPGSAGSATLKRGAILSALLREQGSEGGPGRQRVGILARILENGRQFPASSKGIFCARGANGELSQTIEARRSIDVRSGRTTTSSTPEQLEELPVGVEELPAFGAADLAGKLG